MPQFRYTARNASGSPVDGVVEAADRAGAIAQVEQQRLTPVKISLAGDTSDKPAVVASKSLATVRPTEKPAVLADKMLAAKTPLLKGKGKSAPAPAVTVTTLSHSHQFLFSEQLAHLLSAGMTLDEALGVLVKRLKHPKLRALSQSLHQSLVDGRSLSQAMRDYPRIFSPLYVNMVSAGEASGSLPTILHRLTGHLAEVKSLRDRVQQALLYPAVLVVIGILLIVVFMNTMVPQLMSFFKDAGAKLPAATQFLIDANELLTHYWWLMAAIGFGAFVLFRSAIATTAGRLAWHRFKWNIPVLSRISRYRLYAQFARTLGTLTANGVTLLRSLELLEEISGNDYIRDRMREVRAAVVDGATLSSAINVQKMFPDMFVDMMSVGEQTGKFSDTMTLIADVYERELDKQVKIVSTLIPPIIMVLIAAIIGTVIYGVLIAVFKLTGGMHQSR